MSPEQQYAVHLRDILDAAQKAEKFVEGVEFAAFEANDEKMFAVTRALEIVGEAAKRIPVSVRECYPDVPWQLMTGMRDRLAHDYSEVVIRRVWDTVQEDLPPLRDAIKRILADLEEEEDG